MEAKEWVYLSGIIISLILGGINLYFTLINRRNALREHIYKEQLAIFMKLPEKFSGLLDLFYDSSRVDKIDQTINDKMEKILDDIYLLTEQAEILSPNELVLLMTKTYTLGNNLSLKALKVKIVSEDIKEYQDSYFELTDLIREHLGIDKLSNENRKMAN